MPLLPQKLVAFLPVLKRDRRASEEDAAVEWGGAGEQDPIGDNGFRARTRDPALGQVEGGGGG